MKRIITATAAVIAAVAVACSFNGTYGSCTPSSTSNSPTNTNTVPTRPAPPKDENADLPILDKIAVVFAGNFSKAEIKAGLDEAMVLYGVPITDENYNRTSGALLVSRKAAEEEGCGECTEMLILDYMIRSHVPGLDVPFADMLGISKAALVAGDR